MAYTRSMIAVLVVVLVSSIVMNAQERQEGEIVHDGECPSNKFPFPIHCRRRVCLPEELIPLCNSDGDCAGTHKCCRPLCSCRVRCVEAVPSQV